MQSVTTGGTRSGTDGLRGLKDRLRALSTAALGPLARGLYAAGVRPDHVTMLGLGLSLASGAAFFAGRFVLGSALAAASGVCDILDGQLARVRATPSRFGAFLDSTLDRVSDAAILLGIAGFYVANLVGLAWDPEMREAQVARGLEPGTWAIVAGMAVLALVGSLMVSYTRARAEGLGLECKVGWFERPERLVMLIAAGLFGVGPVMPWTLLLLTVFSFATALQRVVHVHKHTRGAGLDQ